MPRTHIPARSVFALIALVATALPAAAQFRATAGPARDLAIRAQDGQAGPSHAPVRADPFEGVNPCGDESITQSTNPNTVAALTVWCGTTTVSALNSVARGFTLTEDVGLVCVTFGVRECSGGDWPVRVRVLQGSPGDPYDSLTLLSESEHLIPDGADRQLFTVQTPPIDLIAGGAYVVELLTPSRLVEDGGDGGLISLGFNSLGQSAPTYFRAPACDVEEFVTMQSIGLGNRHLVMALGVVERNCYVCSPPSPNDRVESEAHCVTTVNGGCDIATPAFTRISDECSWCGNLWLNDPGYDTDWYRFDLSAPGMVTINLAVDASFGVIVEVYEASGCPVGPAELVDTYDVRCYPGLSSRSNFFNAGTHLIRLVPGTLAYGPYTQSGISCGYGVNYRISVQGVPGSCDDDPGGTCEPISLQDPSFEAAPLNAYAAVLNNFTGLAGQWGAENATIITGTVDGVTPIHGANALRLVSDGLTTTQVVQVLDLTSLATQIDAGSIEAEFAASFNASNGVSGPSAYTMLRYYTGPGLVHQTTNDSVSHFFDGNPLTWERHSVTATIPAGTRWIVAEIGFTNSTIGSLAGFVDDTDLCIRQIETDPGPCRVFWTARSFPNVPWISTAAYNGAGATIFHPAAVSNNRLAFTKLPSPRVFWGEPGPTIFHADPAIIPALPGFLTPGPVCTDPAPLLAASATHVYIGCWQSLTIHRVDRASPFTATQLPLSPAQIGTLRAMIFDEQNNRLLIARDGLNHGEIWSYNPVSHAFTQLDTVNPGSSSFSQVYSLDLDRLNGDLYVLGKYTSRFSPDQPFIRRITPGVSQADVLLNPPGLSGPVGFLQDNWHAIAVDALAGRMWWTTLNSSIIAEVRTATLNGASPTVIATGLPGEIFEGLVVTRCCPVDLNGDGILDLGDIVSFVTAFVVFDPLADLAAPFGVFDLADVVGFVSAFGTGCP